jgi:beta-glucosidase
MFLPFGQDELIRALLDANPSTIIVLMGGAPVDMRSWRADAKGILQAWYPGMEGGNALADILFGRVNPSGKLPMTFPERLADSPAHSMARYPDENLLIDHTDDIYVGYRYFDTYEIAPAFAFGHGLSYTTFEYGNLHVERQDDRVLVRVTLTNTGSRSGGEVVQVYVHDQEASVDRPEKELKEFRKVFLDPGASRTIEMTLDESAFSFFDEHTMAWVREPGAFTVRVGSSSRDIRLQADVVW